MRNLLVSLVAGAGGLALAAPAWAAPPPDTVPESCQPYLAPGVTSVPPECQAFVTPEAPMTTPPPAYAAPEPPAVAPAPAPKVRHARRHNRVFSPWETAITTGAGVTDYFGSAFPSATDPGAAWDARLTIGTRSILAFEAAYVGSINQLNIANQEKQGHLNSNGFDTDLRINILPFRVQPYVFGGVGYAHMHVDNADASPVITTKLNNDVDQFTVPAGAGVSTYIGKHATLDFRGTYRLMPDNRLTTTAAGGLTGDSIHSWTASARLGYAF